MLFGKLGLGFIKLAVFSLLLLLFNSCLDLLDLAFKIKDLILADQLISSLIQQLEWCESGSAYLRHCAESSVRHSLAPVVLLHKINETEV